MKKRKMRQVLAKALSSDTVGMFHYDGSFDPDMGCLLDAIRELKELQTRINDLVINSKIKEEKYRVDTDRLRFSNEQLTNRLAITETVEKEALLQENNRLKSALERSRYRENDAVSFTLASANNKIATLEAEIARVQCRLKTFEKNKDETVKCHSEYNVEEPK